MESKTFLDFLPNNFRHEKSFFIQNNLTDFEKLSNLSDLDINEIQRKSSLCTWNNLKKIRALIFFRLFHVCLLYTSPSPRDRG